jgi:ABC-type transporter MlaC component
MLLTLDAPPLPDTADPIGDDKPTDVLRRAVQSLLETADPETAADALFDVPVVARRCLGRHWPERTREERIEVSRSLRLLLATTLRATLESASRIRYLGHSASGPLVTVRAEVAAEDRTVATLELRVHRVGGRWLVNDFSVGGASFVAQHRVRFERVFGASGVEALSSPR